MDGVSVTYCHNYFVNLSTCNNKCLLPIYPGAAGAGELALLSLAGLSYEKTADWKLMYTGFNKGGWVDEVLLYKFIILCFHSYDNVRISRV